MPVSTMIEDSKSEQVSDNEENMKVKHIDIEEYIDISKRITELRFNIYKKVAAIITMLQLINRIKETEKILHQTQNSEVVKIFRHLISTERRRLIYIMRLINSSKELDKSHKISEKNFVINNILKISGLSQDLPSSNIQDINPNNIQALSERQGPEISFKK
ncbi:hypothetical protein GUI12_04490 [Anaplasmataceae bacterium AB001_6]|nr:hypothetical protein GUI12_04490 [Anaplasmataceae bacterium AB001_6]